MFINALNAFSVDLTTKSEIGHRLANVPLLNKDHPLTSLAAVASFRPSLLQHSLLRVPVGRLNSSVANLKLLLYLRSDFRSSVSCTVFRV